MKMNLIVTQSKKSSKIEKSHPMIPCNDRTLTEKKVVFGISCLFHFSHEVNSDCNLNEFLPSIY